MGRSRGVREVPGGPGRVVEAGCCGDCVGRAGTVVGGGVACVWALVLIGVLGRLHGAESREEVEREWRGGESGPSLLSSDSRRRHCVRERLAEVVCCGDE